jgi:hypothetical protein
LLTVGDVLVAGLLLVTGAAKLVAPAQPILALRELGPRLARLATRRTVRAAASVEAVSVVLLVVPATRLAGAVVVGLLGLAFAGLGVLGARGGGTASCGCLGAARGRPLGPANVVVGATLVLVSATNFAVSDGVLVGWREGSGALGAAVGALLLSAWLHRRLIAVLVFRRAPALTETAALA